MNAGRVDIRADRVHNGIDLPGQYRGENVIVGVIDSGIDFTHPDFSDEDGTRILYLLEYTDNGQNEWTKEQIDSEPDSVTQRDDDEGFGHGTHVTGIAAGGGKHNEDFSGIAPNSDIIFVKGMINGGFSDADVVAGCFYIFQKAGELEKPAVINLSLGSNWGPLDGTSLYEQALSSLTGPGRIIVTAAGNEGFMNIHAGAQLNPQERHGTLLIADNPDQALINMWFPTWVSDDDTLTNISQVAIGAFTVDANNNLVYLGNTDFVAAGSFMGLTPFVAGGDTVGTVIIDARTLSDPRNFDGNIQFGIFGDLNNNIDIRDVIWLILYDTPEDGGGWFDMWTVGGEFLHYTVGLQNITEIPGDTDLTVVTPASALLTIAVASYVTKNEWVDVDSVQRQWLNPHPNRIPNQTVVPDIGQRSYFSSKGPTRDRRRFVPEIAAPGELIFSAFSSHLTAGVGYQRELLLQGDRYLGMQGTSMAAPHVTGIIALMLQVDPMLTYESVVAILQETARVDVWTGAVPNFEFGGGKVDAFAAINRVITTTSTPADSRTVPISVMLEQNFPNPFNPVTTIRYGIPNDGNVKLAIYNVLGQLIEMKVNEYQTAGFYDIEFDASHLPSGIYFYRFESGGYIKTKKLTLVK